MDYLNKVTKRAPYNLKEEEMDCFSVLPDHLLDLVVSFLPIKEAAKTSILSRRWRHTWTSITHIDIRLKHPQNFKELVRIINGVLSSHRVLVRRFKIALVDQDSSDTHESQSIFVQWAEELTRRGVKELLLLNLGEFYPAPSCILQCKSLTVLELKSCLLKHDSSSFTTLVGCTNLVTLKLESVRLSDVMLWELVASCDRLESLHLVYCIGLRHIIIHHRNLKCLLLRSWANANAIDVDAPNLQVLKLLVPSTSKSIRVRAPNLWSSSIGLVPGGGGRYRNGFASELMELLMSMEKVGKLKLNGASVECLCSDDRFWNLTTRFHTLTRLCISLNSHDRRKTCVLAVLLRCFPNLQELRISLYSLPNSSHGKVFSERCEKQESFNCLQYHLKKVEVLAFTAEYQLELVKFLLTEARVLKSMTIGFQDACPGEQVAVVRRMLLETGINLKGGALCSVDGGGDIFSSHKAFAEQRQSTTLKICL